MIHQVYGPPEHVTTKVLKTMTRETWHDQKVASNRYALKILLENGVCAGWEQA